METIPPIYWMFIILVFTGFICLIFYHIAMLLKETKETMTEVKSIVRESKTLIEHSAKILEETVEIVSSAKKAVAAAETMVYEVKDQIIKPIRAIGGLFSNVASFAEGFRKGK